VRDGFCRIPQSLGALSPKYGTIVAPALPFSARRSISQIATAGSTGALNSRRNRETRTTIVAACTGTNLGPP
jgi:hypothetical protein